MYSLFFGRWSFRVDLVPNARHLLCSINYNTVVCSSEIVVFFIVRQLTSDLNFFVCAGYRLCLNFATYKFWFVMWWFITLFLFFSSSSYTSRRLLSYSFCCHYYNITSILNVLVNSTEYRPSFSIQHVCNVFKVYENTEKMILNFRHFLEFLLVKKQ